MRLLNAFHYAEVLGISSGGGLTTLGAADSSAGGTGFSSIGVFGGLEWTWLTCSDGISYCNQRKICYSNTIWRFLIHGYYQIYVNGGSWII